MKRKSKLLIKSLLLSATLSLLPNHADAVLLSPVDGDDDDAILPDELKAPVWHNVMKIGNDGNMTGVESHRSHRSHSSHSSHRSGSSGHRSHYSSRVNSHYSSATTTTRSTGASTTKTATTFYSAPAKTYKTYTLGDRTLRRGMYGSDVSELVKLLKDNGYLHPSHNASQSGYALYDAEVEQAVKYLQEELGQSSADGIFSSVDGKQLTPSQHRRIGTRDLSVDDTGDDVAELIRLLTQAGFAPDTAAVQPGSNTYGAAVVYAVMEFQASVGLSATGVADAATIKALQAKARK